MERIPEEVIEAYEKSDSYQELKRQVSEWRNLLEQYYKKYCTMEQYFKEVTEEKKDHEKYATRGLTHRGLLCPGNMEALLISNVKKGKYVKKDKNPDYIYYYDKDDKLISCVDFDGPIINTEYIMWEDNYTQVGVKYFPEYGNLDYIAIATYNDEQKLTQYLFGDFIDEKATSLNGEKYVYQDDKVCVTWIDATENFVRGEHVVLHLDQKGVVKKYSHYSDMNPEEVFEGIPKYKFVF